MTQTDPEQIKTKLKAQIAELEAQIEEFKQHTAPVEPDKAVGRLSRLDEMNAKSVHHAALNNAQESLQKLKYKLVTVGTPLYQP